jgi:D-3-phosphoglycerate dehydrogenase
MEVLVYDIALDRAFCSHHGVEGVGLEELLSSSDFVTLHLPADASTHNLIQRRELRLMKREAFLINVARGGIVNEKDLYESLLAGEIAGAALDVFEEEPPRDSPLLKLDNVVVTPHIGAYTREVLREMSLRAARNVVEVMRGKRVKHVVNPEVYKKTPRRG